MTMTYPMDPDEVQNFADSLEPEIYDDYPEKFGKLADWMRRQQSKAEIIREVATEMQRWTKRFDDAQRIPEIMFEMADRLESEVE